MTWAEAGRAVIEAEQAALAELGERLDERFEAAVRHILDGSGHVVVSGLGKSGLVGAKIAASLSSTGTPAFFVHSADALHGDAGAITPGDVVIAISNSGATTEVVGVAALAAERGCVVVAMTGDSNSPLARRADAVLDIGVAREADPLGLAPTTSTTATIAMGDAIVAALMQARDFTRVDFGRNHPGGALGQLTREPD